MKFALVNDQRHEPEPALAGTCPACGSPTIAKCGESRIWHWAHKSRQFCDHWWENETEWHRAWKGQFPDDWQEIVHRAPTGERHIADVRTQHGWVIEFQHSFLTPEERRSRNTFYPKLVWVIDGTRRKKDAQQFVRSLNRGVRIGANLPLLRVFTDECALLREWSGSTSPVFVDFGPNDPLWLLLARRENGPVYVGPYARAKFIEGHRAASPAAFEELVIALGNLIVEYEASLQRTSTPPLPGFRQHLMRRARSRRRL